MSFSFWCVIAYFGIMVAVGFYFTKKMKTEDDFTVAGRSLPAIVVAGTLLATWMGSGTVVGGQNSLAYQHGPWVAIIFGLAAPLGLASAADIIEMKYGSVARLVATILMLIAYLGILSYQFTGVGYVLNITLGISTEVGTIIALIAITIIAAAGGLFSVAYTDFLSAVLMTVGLLVGVPVAIHLSGGWSHLASMLPPEHLSLGGLTIPQTIGYFLPLESVA